MLTPCRRVKYFRHSTHVTINLSTFRSLGYLLRNKQIELNKLARLISGYSLQFSSCKVLQTCCPVQCLHSPVSDVVLGHCTLPQIQYLSRGSSIHTYALSWNLITHSISTIMPRMWLCLPMDAACKWTASRLIWTNKWQGGVQPRKVVPGRRPWPSIHTLSTGQDGKSYWIIILVHVVTELKSKQQLTWRSVQQIASSKPESLLRHFSR